jgi:formamidopyrimidine-DNA glycosylase
MEWRSFCVELLRNTMGVQMPELPDVETFRRYMAATSLHKKIKKVDIQSREVLKDVSASQIKDGLKGRKFEATRRHGKYLAALLDGKKCLVMHFGMTGFLKYFKNQKKKPLHERLLITFANGYHLAYDCQRKLGLITLVKDFDQFIEEKALGPDALSSDLAFRAFKEAAARSRASIKSFLMNQEVVAGIGNVYADEILFQGKVHPKARTNQLPLKALRRIFAVRKRILKTSIAHQANPEEFPSTYITPLRGRKRMWCGGRIKKTTISGRTTYCCAGCQKH